MASDLTLLKYLNVLAYLCNAGVTYTIGANVEASVKYQTLVTPVGFAFSIWGVIFISQLIFVIVQLLPTYRLSPLVTDGIGYKYIWVCLAQAAWCPTFSIFEITSLALVFMIMILVFLTLIVRDQYKVQHDSTPPTVSCTDYSLLQFPFAAHCGWIAAASLVSINVVLVAFQVSATVQYVAAILSLLVVIATTVFCVAYLDSPLYVIPSVLAWATVRFCENVVVALPYFLFDDHHALISCSVI
jgi:hypothetical protein